MNPQTYIFIGPSGSGKGTQAALLMEYLKKADPAGPDIFYLETGKKFREFIKLPNHTSELSYNIYKSGKRQPDFLAVHLWAHIFIESFTGREHLVLDGTPRSLHEAQVLATAMEFYNRQKPTVIYVKVSRAWAEARLHERKRIDDLKPEEVTKRLDWFDTDVLPAVEYFKSNLLFTVLEINGEQTIEQVHADMIAGITR